jgi:hypothetical protein
MNDSSFDCDAASAANEAVSDVDVGVVFVWFEDHHHFMMENSSLMV